MKVNKVNQSDSNKSFLIPIQFKFKDERDLNHRTPGWLSLRLVQVIQFCSSDQVGQKIVPIFPKSESFRLKRKHIKPKLIFLPFRPSSFSLVLLLWPSPMVTTLMPMRPRLPPPRLSRLLSLPPLSPSLLPSPLSALHSPLLQLLLPLLQWLLALLQSLLALPQL